MIKKIFRFKPHFVILEKAERFIDNFNMIEVIGILDGIGDHLTSLRLSRSHSNYSGRSFDIDILPFDNARSRDVTLCVIKNTSIGIGVSDDCDEVYGLAECELPGVFFVDDIDISNPLTNVYDPELLFNTNPSHYTEKQYVTRITTVDKYLEKIPMSSQSINVDMLRYLKNIRPRVYRLLPPQYTLLTI